MKLFIDSTNNLETVVRLDDIELKKTYSSPREQNVLGAIDELLKKESKNFKDITEIEVNPGPGSFTGTRVGVSIANALAFASGIKINGQQPPIFPKYAQPPHITTPKNKDK